MLKKYKNALFFATEEAGIEPSQLYIQERGGLFLPSQDTVIKLLNTPFRFILRQSEISYDYFNCKYIEFKPKFPMTKWLRFDPQRYLDNENESLWDEADNNMVRTTRSRGSARRIGNRVDSDIPVMTFDRVLIIFQKWLENDITEYFNEQRTLDIWAHATTYKDFFKPSIISEKNTSGFSESEKEEIRRSVQTYQRLIEQVFQPSQQQMRVIMSQLDYLSKAVDRLNRFDWQGLAISTVMSIAINLTVDTDKGRLLYHLFLQAFQSVLKLLPG